MVMRRLFSVGAFLLLLALASPALADELPACTQAEFRAIYDQVAQLQLELSASLTSRDDLLAFAQARIDERGERANDPPDCADAFAVQRLRTELRGDFLGSAALELAGIPASDNPYKLHLADEQERIAQLASQMLGVDRSNAPKPSQRRPATCGQSQQAAMNDMLSQYLTLTELDAAQPAALIDALVRWREVYLPQAPVCGEGVQLALLLSAAATDAAARLALETAMPAGANPYDGIYAADLARLQAWQAQLDERLTAQSETPADNTRLPRCSLPELAQAYAMLMPAYSDLLLLGSQIASADELPGYSQAIIDFRADKLANLPSCAEAFAVGWAARQLLDELVFSSASDLLGLPSAQHDDGSASVARMIDGIASQLESAGQLPSASAIESARACTSAELLFTQVYLLPELHSFATQAFAATTLAEALQLQERSADLRALLLRELPPCAEAIEIGFAMRRATADFAAMLLLEALNLPLGSIPQAQTVVNDMRWLMTEAASLEAQTQTTSPAQAAASYYISGQRGANIRACPSTTCDILATALSGEPVDIVDAADNWYAVNLPNGQVGYVASFLVSRK